MTSTRVIPILAETKVHEWRYGLQYRPADFASVPKGFLRVEEATGDARSHARHGIVIYGRPLTAEEIKSFELIPHSDVTEVQQLADRVASELGRYARGYVDMAGQDVACFRGSVIDAIQRVMGHRVYVGDSNEFCEQVLSRLRQPVKLVLFA